MACLAVRCGAELETMDLRPFLPLLGAEERARLEAMTTPQRRAEFALARSLVRRVLGGMLERPPAELRIRVTTRGKPYLDPPAGERRIFFSLSHTDGWMLLAVSRQAPVGADVERIARYPERIARRFCHPDELGWLAALPGDAARADGFYRLWTVKEACVKALGMGIAHPLRTVRADDGPAGRSGGIRWWRLEGLGGAHAAVARLGPGAAPPILGFVDADDLTAFE